ncbi:MAG: family 10 glycosylhydrolase [Betaproteobacteria bacterium]|nr:family 10 glycosylhydrolase [Betaproteobacteria bacterium]
MRACAVQAAGVLALSVSSCARLRTPGVDFPADAMMPPPAPREFRGVWVASVANIDWPSRPGLPASAQMAEATALLDRAQSLRLNAVILQVRPAADALYASDLEPWSEYLTGTQGQPPQPLYDPLAFWVAEAHRRGIELHAWFNPFRARHSSARSPLSETHFARRHPDAVLSYGDQLWLDPGNAQAVEQSLAVIADVARRYDVDGVHIDDYFYPYPIEAPDSAGADASKRWLEFPDNASWQAYLASGDKLTRNDWRRDNVNRFVEQLYRTVRSIKPWLKVGISPFGVGRPERRPAGITGFSQYDQIYADVEHWLKQGWLDYLAPQLYWPINQPAQAFGVLYDYWLQQNPQGRHVWPGLFTSQIGIGIGIGIGTAQKNWSADEIIAQIALARSQSSDRGHIHFSMVALAQNRQDIATRLAASTYAEPALVPAAPWLKLAAPPMPQLVASGVRLAEVKFDAGSEVNLLAIWRRYAHEWRFTTQPATQTVIDLSSDAQRGEISAVVVSLVNRAGAEGPRGTLRYDG